jgi:hypothetical protein
MVNDSDNLFTSILRWIFVRPIASCIFFAFLGAVWGWGYAHNAESIAWNQVGAGTVFGFSCGLLHVVDGKYEKQPDKRLATQAGVGCASGAVIALLLQYGAIGMFIAACVGMALGMTARSWLQHINLS